MAEARRTAQREGTTLRALVEEGLRRILGERRARQEFRLRRASVRGKGLKPGVTEGDWEGIRRRAYDGRGE